MTSIAVRTIGTFVGEKRDWLLSDHGVEPNETPGITLDIAKFTAGTHYPDGYIPSGIALGKVTTTGLYGPYDAAANDGRQKAAGLLFASLPVQGNTRVGGALVQHAFVDAAKLPANSGLTTAGRADLPLIIFTN
ncbi:head decoration protein [Nocardia arthritidis]|uniref:Head decoration protein n=1 Tax=Nocardia arthritidis TaxID=228602 RepID=A0A6G9YTF5_9NOCA|nr:head decoration protein [Nocardia arthritidis]QIS16492.1 head decoration protein [Nocardia arthritidis]